MQEEQLLPVSRQFSDLGAQAHRQFLSRPCFGGCIASINKISAGQLAFLMSRERFGHCCLAGPASLSEVHSQCQISSRFCPKKQFILLQITAGRRQKVAVLKRSGSCLGFEADERSTFDASLSFG